MKGVKLSEKSDNLSPAEMKETSIRARQLLAISRWPVFLGVGSVWLLFSVLGPMCVTNKATLNLTGWGIVILTLIFGSGKMRQRFMLGKGFALYKGETVDLHQPVSRWMIVLGLLFTCVIIGGLHGIVMGEKTFLPLLCSIMIMLVVCGFPAIFFYVATILRLWEFIFLGVIIMGALYGIISRNVFFGTAMIFSIPIAIALIVVGLSFMRRWFVWRRSLKTMEGKESE